MAHGGYAGSARGPGGAAQGGQPDPGGAGQGLAGFPRLQPHRGPVPQRLLPHAGQKPDAHAGAGDGPACAGISAPYGGGGDRKPPPGPAHRRGDRGPDRPHRPHGPGAGQDHGLGQAVPAV